MGRPRLQCAAGPVRHAHEEVVVLGLASHACQLGLAEENGGEFCAVAIAALDDIELDADQLVRTLNFNDGPHDDLI